MAEASVGVSIRTGRALETSAIGSVTKFGARKSLGVQRAGLFQFERRLARDGKRRTAADRDQRRRGRQRRERLAPIELRRLRQASRQPVAGRAMLCRRSMRDQTQRSGERGDESFCRRDAQFGPGRHRQDEFASLRQRAIRIVDDGRGDRVGGARRGSRFDQVVARSGLRDREEQLILERKPAMIDAGDIRRRRRDRNAEISLDQMLGEGRCMRRASPRAGHDDVRRSAREPGDERGQRRGKLARLRLHGGRRLGKFAWPFRRPATPSRPTI